MKRVTAYVNTTRIHWLAEELVAAGVKEIRVIEHFSPTSQISRLQLCCEDGLADKVREIIRRLGTTGSPPDFHLLISEVDPSALSRIPLGQRMSALEEPQLASRIRSLFKGATTRITVVFMAITLSIAAVGLFTHIRLKQFQDAMRDSAHNVRMVVEATSTVQTAHLEEMLAAERLHRGDGEKAVGDFKVAQQRLGIALTELQRSQLVSAATIDPIMEAEIEFQSIMDQMFGILSHLSESPQAANHEELSGSHVEVMTALDVLQRRSLELLASLRETVSVLARKIDAESAMDLNAVRLSLAILTMVAAAITILMWCVTRRKVSLPLELLVEEARALDDGELK